MRLIGSDSQASGAMTQVYDMHAHYNSLKQSGTWFKRSLIFQMANIGIEVERIMDGRRKGDLENSKCALWRALDLIWLTVEDPKNRKRLKEIVRMREVLLDYFMGDNVYKSTDKLWHDYFYAFCYAAALERGR